MRYAGSKQLGQLIKNMRLQFYETLEDVVEEGEEGHMFCIILSGRYGMFKTETDRVKVRELMAGQCFGEISILNGEPYQTTITALEPSELIILDKNIYDAIVKSVQNQQMHSSYLFFKGLPLFSSMSEKLIHYFSQTAYIRCFAPNITIIEEGDFAPGIYIISEGSVKVKRALVLDRKPESVVIDELGVGDLFCDFNFFSKTPMHHSIISTMPLTVYFLNKEDILNLDSSLLFEFRRVCKPYPDDSALRYMYQEKKSWIRYKQEIVKTVNIEKELRRYF
jgi:CRP-like cAMP-binding protein